MIIINISLFTIANLGAFIRLPFPLFSDIAKEGEPIDRTF